MISRQFGIITLQNPQKTFQLLAKHSKNQTGDPFSRSFKKKKLFEFSRLIFTRKNVNSTVKLFERTSLSAHNFI